MSSKNIVQQRDKSRNTAPSYAVNDETPGSFSEQGLSISDHNYSFSAEDKHPNSKSLNNINEPNFDSDDEIMYNHDALLSSAETESANFLTRRMSQK